MDRDEQYREQLLASIDDETLEWVKDKSIEYIKLMSYYRCAMMEIETKFKVLKEEYSLVHDRNPINSIRTRLKSPKSIKEKMERLGHEISLESIEKKLNDVAGIRIICAFKDDVYTLADALLKQDDVTLIQTKDYIKNPKENGYRSLHMIVSIPIYLAHTKREMKVEVQFRTIAMDSWASMEHQIVYKKDVKLSKEMQMELDECADLSAALDEKMNNLRKSLFEKECIINPK
ncbi:MAG: GTP pyrophosphokinase family protein [Ruminococcaceae bacterium]|nr:GTP pyrophosphokinase family protein [Oscillospiraceae bacterium]